MYEVITLRDKIRLEPKSISDKYEDVIKQNIRQNYIGRIVEEKMIIVGLVGIDEIGDGLIIPNDAAIYYDTTFRMLAFYPMLHESIKGQVSNISEIGAIINIGPIDGLAHISQVMDDFVDFSKNSLVGRRTKVSLKTGDQVLANVIAISTKGMMKVGLTMRSPGLGKLGVKKKEKAGTEKKPSK
ncbi:DNA-directed RNA polymerase [Candidatus Parvarchaeota archaeon]|nr:DNA-directed RNA polymerase [Candidatus Parvarchaeota archaeon]